MRRVSSKWKKFAVLQRHEGVAKHLPVMMRFSADRLRSLLERFAFVVAKPIVGTGGKGVIKIEKSEVGYRLHYYETRLELNSWEDLLAEINRIRGGSRYMLQQGIQLASIGGRPIDYRVKMVKDGAHWHITAIVARQARQGYFVTNLCRGGEMRRGTAALRQCFPKALVYDKKETMRGVARTCTFLLEKAFPGIGTLGYDFGIDREGTVWILEVNTQPH